MARQWYPLLELQFRKCHGIAFQDFVGNFFGALYPDDFIRVTAHGKLGDGGMDGFRQSDGTLYQCYGARNGHVQDVRHVCDKLKDDFETARLKTLQMKRWLFTNNLIDLPRPLVDAFLELQPVAESCEIEARLCGIDTFKALLSELDEEKLEDLIGVAVYARVDTERLPENVNLRQWEQDLEFLHDRYYLGRFGFTWPSPSIHGEASVPKGHTPRI